MGTAVSESKTLVHERIKRYRLLIQDYELIKKGIHPTFKRVGAFYEVHRLHRATFLKYYGRFKNGDADTDLLPRKRGPRYKTRRALPFIEKKVVDARLLGNNKYEIAQVLKPYLKGDTPSPSGIYNILKRHNLNRLTPKMKETKRKIIKEKAGELGHIDCHYLKTQIVKGNKEKLYLVSIIDDCTRVAHGEVVKDLKSITVMFATLRIINIMYDVYKIKFREMMADNGPEFGNRQSTTKDTHPFQRMLVELGIERCYMKPYRPQTNGKIERFWRTLNEDMLVDAEYDNIEDLKRELAEYLGYYNNSRPHQGIEGRTPVEQLDLVEKCD